MIITKEKIEVTEQMMFDNGLSKMWLFGVLGVPETTKQGSLEVKSIEWKKAGDLTENDFNLIEEYFLNKTCTIKK